ncbi:MAG: hypothetical protein ABEJ84_03385 [Halodesulfurarchaeum sp.]
MNRLLAVLVAIAVIVSVSGPAMALAPAAHSTTLEQTSPTPTNDTGVDATNTTTVNGTNDSVVNETNDTMENTTTPTPVNGSNDSALNETPPGVLFAGSIAVQQAKVRGAIEHRAFGLQIAAAATNRSKAQVLNRTQEHLQERLSELETQMERLNQSRANGSISQGQYQVRLSALVTRVENLERMINSTSRTAAMLPRQTLQANGVNVTALNQLRMHAQNMTGPEVAAIARQIAGRSVGRPMGPPKGVPGGPPEGVPAGPPDDDGTRMGPANGTPGGPGGDADNDTRMGPGNGNDERPGAGMSGKTTAGTTENRATDGTAGSTESAPNGGEMPGNSEMANKGP